MEKEIIGAHEILDGKWITVRLMGGPINRMITAPTLEFDITKKKIYGQDSCNNFSGEIKQIDDTKLSFVNIALTSKICGEMEVADQFDLALQSVAYYSVNENGQLILFDKNEEELLAFLKQ